MPMPQLKIALFGVPLIEVNEGLVDLGRRKATALLAYLAVTGQPHSRDTLATLLWPDNDQVNARAALRSVLNSVKAALGENWLQIDREMIALKLDENSQVDVTEFRRLIAEVQTHNHRDESACSRCIGLLTKAVNLYRDDFMAGFTLPDSASFDEWQSFQADQLREGLGSALERLVNSYSAARNYQPAIAYAQRRLGMDSFHEPAHRALMQLYAWSDQRAAALRQYEACQTALRELGVSPEKATVALYMAIKDGSLPLPEIQTAKPPERPVLLKPLPPAPRHNLPVKLTPFLAREAELTQIAGLLADSVCRLLTLTGLGGIGKTRLALEAAEDQVNCFAQGVFYVPLTPVHSAELLIQAIADAFHLTLQGSVEPQAQLFNYLRDKELLLVLDNFDHLLDAALILSDLLVAAPRIKIMTTSREPLALEEEWLLRVEGMPYPDSVVVSGVDSYDSVQLFLQSARRVQPSFALSRELPSIVRICKVLNGMPLGIELAAGNLYTLPCPQIAEQIEHNIDLLKSSLRNVPERHRSLRAVFEQSWLLLTAVQQNILMKLCAFRGGFSAEAALEVADAAEGNMRSLAEKSLLDIDPAGRYDMHEMLRQFAEEKLVASGEQDTVRLRHLNYFCKLAELAEPQLQRADQVEWLHRLDTEQGNFRAALDRALESQNSEMALRLVSGLWRYWAVRIPYTQGQRTIAQALALPAGDSLARAQALYGNSVLARQEANYVAAQDYCNEALVLFRQLDNQRGIAYVLANQGTIARRQSNFDQAHVLYEAGLDIFRTLNDEAGIAFALNNLGGVMMDEGSDHETSMQLYSEALSIQERLGDKLSIANTVYNLGIVAHDVDDYPTACARYERSIALYEDLGDQRMAAAALYNLADIANTQKDYETAQGLLERCLAVRNELGDRRGRAFVLIALSEVALAHGNANKAAALLKESLTFFQETGEKRNVVYVLEGLANVAILNRNAIAAARLLGATDGLLAAIKMTLPPHDQAAVEQDLAAARQQLGEAAFQQAYAEGLTMTLDDAIAFALT